MAGITQAQAEARLQEYLDAEAAILAGQSFSIAGRTLTRANLGDVQKGIELWNARAKKLDTGGGGVRIFRAVPRS